MNDCLKFTYEVELFPVKCPICGTVFAIEKAVRDGKFICPRGHVSEDTPPAPSIKAEGNEKKPKELQECQICHGKFKSLAQHNNRAHPELVTQEE